MDLLEPFQTSPMRRAVLAALMIGFANGYLSGFVVLRRSALTLGPLSHSILPGIAISVMLFGLGPWTGFVGAMVAALFVGLAATFVARSSRIDANTALAILFTTAFAAGILMLNRLAVTELDHWLFGNILGVSSADLWVAFSVSFVVLLALCAFQRPLLLTLFEPSVAASQGVPVRSMQYLLTALVVLGLVTSLQAVGTILSVSLLVAPAATVFLFANSPRALFWGGGIIGAVVAALAVYLAYWWNTGPGSTIVVLLGGLFILAFLLGPRYGLLARLFAKPHEH